MSPLRLRLPAVIAALLVLLTGALVWERASMPAGGSVTQLSNEPWHSDEIHVHFAQPPLRDGDVLTGVPAPGVARILRDGQEIDVAVSAGRFPLDPAGHWATILFLLTLLGVGVYVFAHRPRDPAARTLLVTSALVLCGATGWLLGGDPVTLATRGPTCLQVAGEAALALVWGAALHFALILPGSELRPGRRTVAGLYALPLAMHAAYLTVALPTAGDHSELIGRLAQISLVASTVLPPVCVLLTVLSYRSMRDAGARRRARGVLVPFTAAVAVLLGLWTVPNMLGLPVPPEELIPVLYLPWSLMLGAAVLRYRWFDIELVVRRSLLYGALSVCVLAIFAGVTWALDAVLGPDGGGPATLVASMLVAVTAQPLLRRLRQRIGRLVYGERADPYEVLERLGGIDAAARPALVLQEIAEALAQTLRLRFVEIDLGTVRASCGNPLGRAERHDLVHGTEVLGVLVLEAGPERGSFGPAEEQLLAALPRQVGHAASAVLLGARLQASREQLVLAREEERRKLHHRLHDGLGAALAANALHMEIARAQLRTDPDAARATLDRLIGEIRELRASVHGIINDQRPADLDRLGLAGAIRRRAAAGIATTVTVDGDLAGLPAAVEVAAFWIAVEAAHNAARHGGATACEVRLTRAADLVVDITDDGAGLPVPVRPGGGFLSMRERAEGLGGRWSAGPVPDGGAWIRATLPLGGSQAGMGPESLLAGAVPGQGEGPETGRPSW